MSYASDFLTKSVKGNAMFFPSSTTYTIPYTGLWRLTGVGAGASGGTVSHTTTGGAASGGGGGAFCEKEAYLVKDDVITATIGAGGATRGANGSTLSGYDGGDTTIVCAARSINMSAGGGLAGSATESNAATATGGIGGTATGGDINVTGGAGGDAKHYTNGAEAGGGGSAGSPYGTGGAGGYAINASTNMNAAGGGGGIGGPGGSQTSNGVGSGGGSGPPNGASVQSNRLLNTSYPLSVTGMNHSYLNVDVATLSFAYGFESLSDPFRALTCGGAADTRIGGNGGGSKGATPSAVSGGILGGGGGCYTVTSQGLSGTSKMGGGSGGCASSANVSAYTAIGGAGFATIERIG